MSSEVFSTEHLYQALASEVKQGRWGDLTTAPTGDSALSVESVLPLPAGDHPEGVAVDRAGMVYVSNRRFVGAVRQGEILKIAPDGTASVLARLPDTTDPLGNGVLGLVTDSQGNLYAALDSRNLSSRGVWRIRSDGGRLERLEGSEHMSFPNALIFDRAENLYATDSEMGAIWRFPLSEPKRPAPWAQDELLAPFAFDPFGIPLPTGGVQPFGLPGANGIGFYPPNHLYVANTEKGLLVHVPIERDGHAGTACIAAGESVPAHLGQWVPDPRLWTMDGIAVDAHGQIYGVVPGFPVLSQLTGLPLSPLVRIDPTRGTVHLVPTHAERFHVPLSLAFGRTAHDRHRVYVTNAAFFSDLFAGSGPGLVCAEVGVPGFHLDESPDEPVGS